MSKYLVSGGLNMSNKGFTLIELIVVISAIAILAGIIVPTVGTLVDDAKVNRMRAECNTLVSAAAQFENKAGYIPFGTGVIGVTNCIPLIDATTNLDPLLNYSVVVQGTTWNFRDFSSKRLAFDPWNTTYGYYEAVGVVANNTAAVNVAGVVGSYGPDRTNGPGANTEWTLATWAARTEPANRGTYIVFKTNR